MPLQRFIPLFAAFFGLCVGPSALAQPNMGAEHLSINAKTDYASMHAGQSGFLAIDIVVEDGWHTYWPGVSDTGYGVSFTFDAPESIEFKEPIWPTPERYLQRGGILDHTYEGTVTVLYPFVVKDNAAPMTTVINIDASFLVCEELCLPGKDQATVSLEIVADSKQADKASEHAAIHRLHKERAKPFDANDLAVRLQWIKGAAAIMFRDATRIEFYPDTECSPVKDLIEDGAADGNRLEIYFSDTQDMRLSGRLRVTTPTGDEFYDINETAP